MLWQGFCFNNTLYGYWTSFQLEPIIFSREEPDNIFALFVYNRGSN